MTTKTALELLDEIDDAANCCIDSAVFRVTFPGKQPRISPGRARERYVSAIAALRAALTVQAVPVACPLCKGTGKCEVGSFSDSTKQIMKSCTTCKGLGYLPLTDQRIQRCAVTDAMVTAAIEAWNNLFDVPLGDGRAVMRAAITAALGQTNG